MELAGLIGFCSVGACVIRSSRLMNGSAHHLDGVAFYNPHARPLTFTSVWR